MPTRRRRDKRLSAAGRIRPGAAYSSPACYLHEFEPASARSPSIGIKRVYEPPARADGYRVLVDRLWPRGISKRRTALDEWLADLAPSAELRKWFHRDLARWREFGRRYRAELRAHRDLMRTLRTRATTGHVTLLYGARDVRRNHAVVLRDVLRRLAPHRIGS